MKSDKKDRALKHLIIIRLSAMGDVAMVVPVVASLRSDYPDLRITILTRSFFKPFFRGVADIEFFTPDFDDRHAGFKGLIRLCRDIKALNVDAVADLHDVLRTRFIRTYLRFINKHVAVIDKGRSDKRAMTRKFRKVVVQLTPTIRRYYDAISSLGFRFSHPVPAVQHSVAIPDTIFAETGVKSGKWVGFAPFAKHRGKVYPMILSDSLIGLLVERYDKVFIFGGVAHEREFAECMQQRHSKVVSVIGKVDLGGELDLMSNLDCMVTMDSGSMHMASLVGTPVVSVWGATHPFAGFYGFGLRAEDAVQLELPCRPCSVYGDKKCMYKDYRCMERIPPTTIMEQITKVIARKM